MDWERRLVEEGFEEGCFLIGWQKYFFFLFFRVFFWVGLGRAGGSRLCAVSWVVLGFVIFGGCCGCFDSTVSIMTQDEQHAE